MPVSPADFALWARATGNKYPETAEEKISAAPHAYEYARNVGKVGQNAPSSRVGGTILYTQPESVQNSSPNSVFNAPVTPDNAARKVAGTVSPTLTSQHFVNQEAEEETDRSRQSNLVDVIGKTALAAGTVAAGVALARNPSVQQAASSAATVLKENAQNISSRVSSFLGGFGGGQNIDPSVVRDSGDVTPPTTGQRFQQQEVPAATQAVQVAKGAPVGDPAKEVLSTTSASTAVKPVTESEIISTSQTFSPENAPTKRQIIQSVLEKTPIADNESEYTPDIPNPYKTYGGTFEKAFGLAAPEVISARRAAQRGELLVDPETGVINNPQNIPGFSKEALVVSAEPQTTGDKVNNFLQTQGAALYGVDPTTGAIHFPTTAFTTRSGVALNPVRHVERPFTAQEKKSMVVKGGPSGDTGSVELPYSTQEANPILFKSRSPLVQRYLGEEETYAADATRSYPVQRIAGARDVEAALATLEATGAVPEGPYSSIVTGESYVPAWGATSGIDPRVVTRGGSVDPGKVDVHLPPAPYSAASKKTWDLYGVTQDPNVLNEAASGAVPLNITLPGGEVVPTRAFFRPFKAVGAAPGSDLTQVENLENTVLGAQTVHNNTKAGVLARAGLHPTTQLRAKDFAALPEADKKALTRSYEDLQNAQNALAAAKENQYLFSIPEELQQGTKLSPAINQATGELVGMMQTPENKTFSPLELLNIRRASSIGSREVGGVGRGESSRTPSRLLGNGGRGYAGIKYEQIDPESFGENAETLKTAFPERVTPEGLLYSERAMKSEGGGSHPGLGTRFRSVYGPLPAPSPGAEQIAAAEQARKQSIASSAPSSYAAYSNDPETAQWRLRVLKGMQQSNLHEKIEEMRKVHEDRPKPVTVQTVREHKPQQLMIPGAGLAPAAEVHPEAQKHFEHNAAKMMARATGRSLQSALLAAQERANPSARQLALF